MDCPVCKEAMVVLELQQVEVDYCFGCGGIWLDAGELELLIDDAEKAQKLMKSFRIEKNSKEEKRKCPICDRKMDKVIAGHAETGPELLIDECRKKHGLWFDSGELQDILRHAELDDNSRIQHLLAEMFAEQRTEENKEN